MRQATTTIQSANLLILRMTVRTLRRNGPASWRLERSGGIRRVEVARTKSKLLQGANPMPPATVACDSRLTPSPLRLVMLSMFHASIVRAAAWPPPRVRLARAKGLAS
jgi:hypothetical protein